MITLSEIESFQMICGNYLKFSNGKAKKRKLPVAVMKFRHSNAPKSGVNAQKKKMIIV